MLPALFAAAEGRSFWHLFLLFTPNQLRGRAERFAVCSLPSPSSRPSLLNPLYSLSLPVGNLPPAGERATRLHFQRAEGEEEEEEEETWSWGGCG